jgi:hypothetical protein
VHWLVTYVGTWYQSVTRYHYCHGCSVAFEYCAVLWQPSVERTRRFYFGQVVGDKPYADNSGRSTVRILGSWASSPLEAKVCVCVCVCVSNESNRISETDVCKPSTRQPRPRSVRSATQTGKEVNLWLCLIRLDILKRKREMEVKFHGFLNSALVRVCDNSQIPAVLWTWWPSVRLNMAAKRTFPVPSRNGTHCNYMVIYDCCSCCGQHCTHLTAPPSPTRP